MNLKCIYYLLLLLLLSYHRQQFLHNSYNNDDDDDDAHDDVDNGDGDGDDDADGDDDDDANGDIESCPPWLLPCQTQTCESEPFPTAPSTNPGLPGFQRPSWMTHRLEITKLCRNC